MLENSKRFRYYIPLKPTKFPTFLGLLAIIAWSTSIAVTRSTAEKMGTLNMAFFNLLVSGALLLLAQGLIYKKELFSKFARLPFTYFSRVGSFMIVYMVLFSLAVGEASTRETVIVIGIINYLWPGLTFLFSIPILKKKAKYSALIPGILAAFAGTTLALLKGNQVSLTGLQTALKKDAFPFLLALLAAVSWAIYSNMTHKFKTPEDKVAMPLFLLTAGFVVLILILMKEKTPRFNLPGYQFLELLYLAVFPTALAYLFWDQAMKHGNKNLVTTFSYLTPLASTLISGLYLDVNLGIDFGLAALLVIGGAFLCKWSIDKKIE